MNASKFIGLLFLLIAAVGYGQEKESDRLKKNQNDLLKKITFTENLLETTKKNQTNLTENLILLDRKIVYRQDLLNNLDIQLSQIDATITNLEIEVIKLEQQIINHKDQYKLMIQQAYKMRNSQASLMFVLSSESFNQANKRLEYLDQLKKYRAEQIKKIISAKAEFERKLRELQLKRDEKIALSETKLQEQDRYVNDREKQKKTIVQLKGQEIQLQDELSQQRKKAADLDKQITRALNEEFRKEREKDKDNPPSHEDTAELELSNKGFESNKGRLPWPVKSGEITRKFGKSPHPVYSTVIVDNPGVDITTVQGSTVRAVYEGVVSSVFVIGGAGKAIIIKHGNYRTIYSNLQETYVSKGDKVSIKQEIGALLVNPSGTSIAHFEIRRVSNEGKVSVINPTYWLAR